MKLIKSSFNIFHQEQGLSGVYKQIELAGRSCYKSEDKIIETSAKEFVNRMIKSGHGGILEHGTIYLKLDNQSPVTGYKYRDNKYSRYVEIRKSESPIPITNKYITTNYRVIMQGNYESYSKALENNFNQNWLSDLEYLCEPTNNHNKRITVKFHCDRITGESFLRHRSFLDISKELEKVIDLNEFDFSYARESTRFCNFSKDKFDNNVKFIIPSIITFKYNLNTTYKDRDIVGNNQAECEWMKSCLNAENHYFNLLKLGWRPENARYALGFSLYSPLIMTGFISDWIEFFKLRTDNSAHPDARALVIPLKQEFIKLGYIKENE